MINRQKLIEAIKKESELHSGGLYEDEILAIIESQPPADVPDTNVGEWIPCSERLPEKSGTYIVTMDWDGMPRVTRLYFTTVEYPRWLTFRNVTAWMPLPEAYKGE